MYVLGDEGDGDDGMLEPNDVFEEELENSLELMEKVGQTSIIKFRLPLYEEVFGSLTKKDFVFPGNEDNAYDMYLFFIFFSHLQYICILFLNIIFIYPYLE